MLILTCTLSLARQILSDKVSYFCVIICIYFYLSGWITTSDTAVQLNMPRLRYYLQRNAKLLLFITFVCLLVYLNLKNSEVNTQSQSSWSTTSLKYRPYHQLIDPNLPLEEKCRAYFTHLFKEQPDWKLTPKLGKSYPHSEKTKSEDLVHLNLYNHCYMSNDFAIVPEWDEKMYPYLSRKLPVFQHWSGVQSYGKPEKGDAKIDELSVDSYKRQGVSMEPVDKGVPFWRYFKANIEGRGIVLSSSDDFITETVKLMDNLKTLGNELPVQIVHRGDLSYANRLRLSKKVREENGLPLFDLWFVDVSLCLNDVYKDSFDGYFNKMLAYSFNSLKEIVLLDTDVVIFKPLDKLFESKIYSSSKTLFFKDRSTEMRMSDEYINFIQNTAPSYLDHTIFGAPFVDLNLFETEYFQLRYFHYMEAGLFLINREIYWNGVLMALWLSNVESFKMASWGEKEHFWLGLVMSGEDSFKFDKYWTGNVGKLVATDNGRRHKICSAHPAHILSESNELAWINSGITNCEKVNNEVLAHDIEKIFDIGYNIQSIPALERYYRQPISFDAFIVPPEYKVATDYPPTEIMDLCSRYYYCVYDSIGPDHDQQGIKWEFSKPQIKWYNVVADRYVQA
ncbi:uncharacterized protein C5L36_0C08550 [Pichia kudriavzevii]|uniref:Uncharacterized protein n=2 Tax=Pichia kudriavzevii TaxID=4909 RepID=A0A2U9R6E3_PICKU|nr:uncharacterized protein C5L36_0C08550 [Pichia kudriavzevii]AWU76942.1 hypothetical protein C5L36_0C08550 [Pichia kudriavzevii]